MMNKNLLSLAVATALAAPAFAPSTASAEAILYGKVNVSVDYIDVEQNATFFRPGNTAGPSFNVNNFFYGTSNGVTNTNPSARALATQQATLRETLGSVPINSNGYYVPTGYQVVNTVFGPVAMQGPVEGSAVANSAAAAGAAAYTANYNWQLSQGASPATAHAVAAAAEAKYAAPAPGAVPSAQYLAAQNAAFALAGPVNGAIAINNYLNTQTDAIKKSVAVSPLTLAERSQANRILFDALGVNGQGGYKAVALLAAAGASIRGGQKYNGWGMDTSNAINGPASRVGVKGSEDLGNGLKAIYQIEIGVDISNANRDYNLANGNRGNTPGAYGGVSSSGFSFRNTFVGLASDFGTLLLGRHDTPLKISTAKLDLFADTLADYNVTIGFQDIRADNAVAYITPNWSGFQFMAAAVPQNASTPVLLTGAPDTSASSFAGSYSLAATYKNGPFFGSVAYEALGESNFNVDNIYYNYLFNDRNAKMDSKVRIGLGLLDWNGFTLTGIYEQRNNINGAPMNSNGNFFQVQAGYAFGNNMVKAMWGRADLEACADPNNVGFRFTCQSGAMGQYFAASGVPLVDNKQKSAWAVGYDYNFSKRTTAFALYTAMSDKINTANWSGFSIGMMHSF